MKYEWSANARVVTSHDDFNATCAFNILPGRDVLETAVYILTALYGISEEEILEITIRGDFSK